MDDTVNQNSSNQTHLCRRCGRKLRSDVSKERGMGEAVNIHELKDITQEKKMKTWIPLRHVEMYMRVSLSRK